MSTDRIEREIMIAAPPERVWAVLTEPAHVGIWFGTGSPAEIDLRPGGLMVLDHGEHGSYSTLIVKVDPPRAFSYRWASAYPDAVATPENSTLVEFSLEPAAGGTVLKVVESGFDAIEIPAARETDAGFESHSKGWTGVIEKVGAYAERRDESPLMPVS
ncbi:MAG TPA: SRPBCC family protein [Acidimicrobiales bacterium]